jgi:hypothetical protein
LCLAVPGQNILDKFAAQRVDLLVRLLVEIKVQISCDGIFARVGRLGGSVMALAAEGYGQRDGADTVRLVTDAGISDCKFVACDVVNDSF